MDFRTFLKDHIVFLDGSTGTLLQMHGLKPGEGTETWNLKHPEIVTAIQKEYYDAGSNVVITNTFGASAYKYADPAEHEKLICAACENLARARDCSSGNQEKFLGLDLGPIGSLLEPFGDVEFEKAVEIYAKAVRAGMKCRPDLIVIETMGDVYETKAAVIAAKENSDLPILVSHTYGKNGRIMTGADPKTVVTIMEGLGADVIGMNCSFGPDAMRPIAEAYLQYASVPVSFKPNAGLPKEKDGKTYYDVDEAMFADIVTDMLRKGVRLAGGCCGTTPAHIRALVQAAYGLKPVPVQEQKETLIASFSQAGPPEEAEFLEEEEQADLEALADLVKEEQESSNDLYGLRSETPASLALALRAYNGKALIDAAAFCKNGSDLSALKEVFEAAKKYGGVLYIPKDCMESESIGMKIKDLCREFDISSRNILLEL